MERKVMVVDDDPYIRLAVREILTTQGIDLLEAEGGSQCLDAMAEGFRGVILMDIMMPEMDGWDTINAIVDNGYYDGSMIFMLTARDEPDEKMEGLQEYVTDYLTKPFDPDELVSIVQEYLGYLGQLEK
jgi:DNA-binding response OmpR family regulator